VLAVGCVDESWQPRLSVQAWSAEPAHVAIAVGLYDFPQSVLLAYMYTEALATKGFPVPVLSDLGARELVHRALINGVVQLVPNMRDRRWSA
jgi:osmoprotectant transport system substrate-binding protein